MITFPTHQKPQPSGACGEGAGLVRSALTVDVLMRHRHARPFCTQLFWSCSSRPHPAKAAKAASAPLRPIRCPHTWHVQSSNHEPRVVAHLCEAQRLEVTIHGPRQTSLTNLSLVVSLLTTKAEPPSVPSRTAAAGQSSGLSLRR